MVHQNHPCAPRTGFADHSLPREGRAFWQRAHDRADFASGSRPAGELCDLAIRHHPPAGDLCDDRPDFVGKFLFERHRGLRYDDPMITIQVRYFAVFRERLGKDEEALNVPDGSSVGDAISILYEKYPQVAALRGKFRAAVNCAFCEDTTGLSEGDELALIPPVAGGTGIHAKMVTEPPSLDRVVAAVKDAARGGVVTFLGVVRAQSQGRAVSRLEYEAYGEMAERVLRKLCEELAAEFPGVAVAIEHRTGVLAVGDTAVAIAAGAPHRDAAFRACRAAIDRLKERAPIWKKEIGPDGAVWVGLGP